jgi:hypothetical protein
VRNSSGEFAAGIARRIRHSREWADGSVVVRREARPQLDEIKQDQMEIQPAGSHESHNETTWRRAVPNLPQCRRMGECSSQSFSAFHTSLSASYLLERLEWLSHSSGDYNLEGKDWPIQFR